MRRGGFPAGPNVVGVVMASLQLWLKHAYRGSKASGHDHKASGVELNLELGGKDVAPFLEGHTLSSADVRQAVHEGPTPS